MDVGRELFKIGLARRQAIVVQWKQSADRLRLRLRTAVRQLVQIGVASPSAPVAVGGERASIRLLEFVPVNIRSLHTRRAYKLFLGLPVNRIQQISPCWTDLRST